MEYKTITTKEISLHPVCQSLELSPLDWMTIRDLIEWSGADNDSPLTVTLALMFAAMREGSLCLELNGPHVNRLISGMHVKLVNELLDQFLVQLEEDRYGQLVATTGKTYQYPLVFEAKGDTKRLYFQRYHLYEKRLHDQIWAFQTINRPAALDHSAILAIIDELFSEKKALRLAQNGNVLARDPEQIAAIRQALSSPLTIISGGPGTGKTSVMVNVLRALVRAGIPAREIALAAPTGRAAQRMTEALSRLLPTIGSPSPADNALFNLTGNTLHKLLRYHRHQHGFYHGKGNPLPFKAVIVDEVSMVDVEMMAKFLEALDPAQTRLVLMGDKDQLPSVAAGAVFAEMIPSDNRPGVFKDHLVVLRTTYRAGTNIHRLATDINTGKYPSSESLAFETALKMGTDNWSMVPPMDMKKWQTCLHRWAAHYYLNPMPGGGSYSDLISGASRKERTALLHTHDGKRLLVDIFGLIGRSKILTLLRRGPWGCEGINPIIEQFLIARMDAPIDVTTGLFSGAVIMVTHNDYKRGLFNGDVGVVIRDVDGVFQAYFQRGDEYNAFAVGQLPRWEPAFAVTVHKSQGSEFDDVLVVLPEETAHRLLTREILYTAITRARQRVIIYGPPQSVKTAISRKIARQSGLVWGDAKIA